MKQGGIHGKRLVAKAGDPITYTSLSMRESKKIALDVLSAKRDWSAAVYLDRLLDGDPELQKELADYLAERSL